MDFTRKFILTSKPESGNQRPSELAGDSSIFRKSLTDKHLLAFELLIAFVFCFVPLLFNNPYRINIFLTWEGAYRMYLGQMPFRDFSLPMGYGYWVIPALFFKIFGPYFYSLIISQVFVNLVSVIAFRSILKLLNGTRSGQNTFPTNSEERLSFCTGTRWTKSFSKKHESVWRKPL